MVVVAVDGHVLDEVLNLDTVDDDPVVKLGRLDSELACGVGQGKESSSAKKKEARRLADGRTHEAGRAFP